MFRFQPFFFLTVGDNLLEINLVELYQFLFVFVFFLRKRYRTKKCIAGTKVKCGFMKLFRYTRALRTGVEYKIELSLWMMAKENLGTRQEATEVLADVTLIYGSGQGYRPSQIWVHLVSSSLLDV